GTQCRVLVILLSQLLVDLITRIKHRRVLRVDVDQLRSGCRRNATAVVNWFSDNRLWSAVGGRKVGNNLSSWLRLRFLLLLVTLHPLFRDLTRSLLLKAVSNELVRIHGHLLGKDAIDEVSSSVGIGDQLEKQFVGGARRFEGVGLLRGFCLLDGLARLEALSIDGAFAVCQTNDLVEFGHQLLVGLGLNEGLKRLRQSLTPITSNFEERCLGLCQVEVEVLFGLVTVEVFELDGLLKQCFSLR